MSREERIENIRFQGGMNVMLNVLERLEKAEERITELQKDVNALTLEVALLNFNFEKANRKEDTDGIHP